MSERNNLFEMAVKGKYRFPYRGLVNIEDLFDLNVNQLDSIFKELNSELKQTNEESLLETKSKADQELEAKIEIVKFVVQEKLAEQEAKSKAKEIKEQKQKIMSLLADKQDEALKQKPIEELQAMLDSLK